MRFAQPHVLTLLSVVVGVGLVPGAVQSQSLHAACASAFGEGWRGQVERATGGPICAKVGAFSIEYQRLDPAQLCPSGAPRATEDGARFVCEDGPAQADAGTGGAQGGESDGVLRPLPQEAPVASAAVPAPTTEAPGEQPGLDIGAVTPTLDAQVEAPASDIGVLEVPQIDLNLGGLFSDEGDAPPAEALARYDAEFGAGWRDALADGVMPSHELRRVDVPQEGGWSTVELRDVYAPCFREEADFSRVWRDDGSVPQVPQPDSAAPAHDALVASASYRMLTRREGVLSVLGVVQTSQSAGLSQDEAWARLWKQAPDPAGLSRITPQEICVTAEGRVPALLDHLAEFQQGVRASGVPTLASYLHSIAELEAVSDLCHDVLGHGLANMAWVSGCAGMDIALRDEVLTLLPEVPPALEQRLAAGMLSPLIPADPVALINDDGAAEDAPL